MQMPRSQSRESKGSYYIITSHAAEFFEVGAYTVDVSFIFVQHEERLKEF